MPVMTARPGMQRLASITIHIEVRSDLIENHLSCQCNALDILEVEKSIQHELERILNGTRWFRGRGRPNIRVEK